MRAMVRPAGPEDVSELARLQNEVWQQAFAGLLPAELLSVDPRGREQAWTQRIAEPGAVLLALEGEEAVGLASVNGDLDDEGYGEIELLYVLPRWSQRGHGGRLLAEAARRLRQSGATAGRWWVPQADTATAGFLTRVGWRSDGANRALDTGEGVLVEERYSGGLDFVLK